MDPPLYRGCDEKTELRPSTCQKDIDVTCGKALWKQLNTVIILDQQMRQDSTDKLHGILSRLLNNAITDNDYKVLQERCVSDSLPIHKGKFAHSPIIVSTNAFKSQINLRQAKKCS